MVKKIRHSTLLCTAVLFLGEDESVLDTKPAAATSITTASNSGVYTDDITVADAADVNYDFTYVPADFTVEKATLTVTADNQQKVYGSDNPVLTFACDGFVLSDDESVLDTKPVASTDIDLTSTAGLYSSAITLADGADNNYQFIYVPGDFNITQAMLTVTADAKSKVYGEDNSELTLMYNGFVRVERS